MFSMVPINILLIVKVTLMFGVRFHFCKHNKVQKSTLELVFTVFRHGDRTNDVDTYYPKDPYINETYFPYNKGELTNKGKEKMYNLGETFRKLYNEFLGPLYLPGIISALSTNYSRTKNSLQLFLAGLFPPLDTKLEWNEDLNWNPISFNYVSFQNNRVLSYPVHFCPKYRLLYDAYKQSPKAIQIESNYQPWYFYISERTGLNITSLLDLFPLYFGLTNEKEWGLKLPEWSKPLYPSYLTNATKDNYKLFTATPQLNQLFGGFFLKKTLRDMYRKINGQPKQPKMYVYSGHEVSIVSILGALKLYYPHIPMYGACVIIQLHNINQQRYVKVLYNKEKINKFVDMKIPGCTVMCPIQDFVMLLKEHIPGDGDPCID